MDFSVLKDTVERFNQSCAKGQDHEFKRPKWSLMPLEDPPYYAVKLWPGGPNTQGGPKRNAEGQICRPGYQVIPGLYAAGELGSIWGMLYQAGGNIAECISSGRLAGVNTASEKPW
jgi:succinate dehydrogenase/fumarate reductase flavoprotein subunit